MKKTLISLQDYGLSPVESLIYMDLLQNGSSSVLSISKRTKLNRSTVHLNITSLIGLGLSSQIQRGNKRVIVAEPPEKLNSLVEQEKYNLKRKEENLKNVVVSIYDEIDKVKENTSSQVKYYEGIKAVRNLYKEVLKSQEIRAYANTQEIVKSFPDNFQLFLEYSKKGVLWDILIKNPHSELYLEIEKYPNFHFKYFPPHTEFEPSDYLIFEDKIAIIYNEIKPKAILISNIILANNAKTIHKLLWDSIN